MTMSIKEFEFKTLRETMEGNTHVRYGVLKEIKPPTVDIMEVRKAIKGGEIIVKEINGDIYLEDARTEERIIILKK